MLRIRHFLKYCIVGTSGTAIDIIVLFILVDILKFSILASSTLSFILATINNFYFNKIWTFNDSNKNYKHQYLRFFLISVLGLLITLLTMFILVNVLNIWYISAKIITSGIILFWNYYGNKNWTFSETNFSFNKDENHQFDYSIIIPAYNEENRIGKTLEHILNSDLKNYSYEIIVVNDGSVDKTSSVVLGFKSEYIKLINLDKNQGKGHAIKSGVLNSNGKFILYMDADNSTTIKEIHKLIPHINDFEIIIGSRKLNSNMVIKKQNLIRRVISRIGSFLSLSLVKNIKDTQCGFKLFKSEVAKELFKRQTIKGFGFDIEILSIAQYYNIGIKEIQIEWSDVLGSRFNTYKDTLKTLKEFIKIHFNILFKKY